MTTKQFDHGFGLHSGLGYFIFLGTVLALLLSLAARLGKRTVLQHLLLSVLLIVQIVLAWIGSGTPAVGALHPVNAFLILGLTGSLAHQAWWGSRRGAPSAAPATPAV